MTTDRKLKLQHVPTEAIGKDWQKCKCPCHFFSLSFREVSEVAMNRNPRTEFDGVLNIFIESL